jgi:hypothetical protein
MGDGRVLQSELTSEQRRVIGAMTHVRLIQQLVGDLVKNYPDVVKPRVYNHGGNDESGFGLVVLLPNVEQVGSEWVYSEVKGDG